MTAAPAAVTKRTSGKPAARAVAAVASISCQGVASDGAMMT